MALKPKKVPMRMCVGCREMKPKKELIRVVRPAEEGPPRLDPTGKASGRGAYLCPCVACLERAVKTKALERALETRIAPEVLEEIRHQLLAQAQFPRKTAEEGNS